jgi:hypothetical protein
MPKIETKFRWGVEKLDKAGDELALKMLDETVGEKLKAGDEILVILEGFHIRDNKDWGSAEINVSLQVATKNYTKDITIGTYTGIKDNDELISNAIVLLPSTKIEDHLNIAVNAIELDRAEGVFSKVPQIMEYIKKLSEQVPIPAVPAAAKTASEVVAAIVNIAGLINTDDTILHNIASYVIDAQKFPNLPEDFYLREGTLTIVETENVNNPTTISLKVIKKNA